MHSGKHQPPAHSQPLQKTGILCFLYVGLDDLCGTFLVLWGIVSYLKLLGIQMQIAKV